MKAEGLPGRRAHEIMVPIPDSGTKPYENTSRIKETRQSAVLILFSLRKPEAILYTLRNDNLPDHGGQISFPGGQQDEEESLLQTSCRELEEEVGIPPSHFRITGSITPLYVTPSRFIIHPWIAVCYDRPEITLQTSEVSEAFWVTLDDLMNEKYLKSMEKTTGGQTKIIPYWDIHKVPLWGATAMITSEFLEIYRSFLSSNPDGTTAK